jgi:hypothetical protein
MKALYKLHFDCGRMGELSGLFIADEKRVKKLMDEQTIIYFGEVLGKHSEVMGPIEENDISFVTSDKKVLTVVEHFKLETGINPFDYIEVGDDDLEDIDVKDEE